MNWSVHFTAWNATNLDTLLVIHPDQQGGMPGRILVHEIHPVVALLRKNRAGVNLDLDTTPKVNNGYYVLTPACFQTCSNAIRDRVLPQILGQTLEHVIEQPPSGPQ
mmetsp:Transcript_73668/g.195972  ORF Transcript_73668/g.195972 Transcript_73668/m.195972 type:complete len:107 (+) Transcript_73668:462-782(+)